MPKDIIAEVLRTESEAENALKEAHDRARRLVSEAEEVRSARIAKAQEAARKEGEALLERTRDEAEVEGRELIGSGRQEAERIEREARVRVQKATQAVVRTIIGE